MSGQLRLCAVTFIALVAVARFADATQVSSVQWTDARTIGPFEIQSNFPLAKYDALFKELPELQREITRTLGVRPATSPIYVYLFANESDYRTYTQRHFPQSAVSIGALSFWKTVHRRFIRTTSQISISIYDMNARTRYCTRR